MNWHYPVWPSVGTVLLLIVLATPSGRRRNASEREHMTQELEVNP